MRQKDEAAGFTLIELLLSAVIITLLVGLIAPVYNSFVQRNDLDLATQTIVAMLRRAETYAMANKTDNVWSMEIQSTAITLFQGTSFSGRNTAYDEAYSLPASITPSGLSEVQFAKLNALPNTTGTITLTSTTSDIRTITVNAKGMVDY